MLVCYTIFEFRILSCHRLISAGVVNDGEIGVLLTLREPEEHPAVVSGNIETERIRNIAFLTGVEPYYRLLETSYVLHAEALAPKLNPSLEPYLIEKLETSFVGVVAWITILLYKIFEYLPRLGLVAVSLGLRHDEYHLLHAHERSILVILGRTAGIAAELDIGIRDERFLDVRNGKVCHIAGSVPGQSFKKRGLEVKIDPPALADIGCCDLVIKDIVDAGIDCT